MKDIVVVMRWLRRGGAEKNTIKIVNRLAIDNNVTLYVLSSTQADLIDSIDCRVKLKLGTSWLSMIYALMREKKASKIFGGDHRIAVYLKLISELLFWKKFSVFFRCINNLSILLYSKSRVQKVLLKYFLSKVDGVIAQCDGMKIDLESNWNVKPEKITVIYNSFPTTKDCNGVDHIKANKSKFIYVGRFGKQKQLELMVRAFLQAKIPNSSLTLVGFRSWMSEDREVKESVENILIDNELANSITIVDWAESGGNELLANYGCFLLSSKFEGFPNVLVESISNGIPVVSTNCDFGPSEIIEESNGIIVQEQTIECFSNAIKMAYLKEWDYSKVKASATKFSDDVQLMKLKEVFDG